MSARHNYLLIIWRNAGKMYILVILIRADIRVNYLQYEQD